MKKITYYSGFPIRVPIKNHEKDSVCSKHTSGLCKKHSAFGNNKSILGDVCSIFEISKN